jgi:4-aminobutyrate aminotransferase-like enzyme
MTTVRLLPPLVITGEQIDLVLEAVADVLTAPAGATVGAQHG